MKPPFSVTNKMLNLIVAITAQTTRLEVEQERNLHMRKENRIRSIHSSLAVEKNSLSFEQVTDIVNGKKVFGAPKEIREVQNAYDAYDLVFQMNPYSIEDFLRVQGLMTRDVVKINGQFRTNDVGVYDGAGNAVHIGVRPQYVYNLIQELFSWAKDTDVPALIKSCVVHFEIEMIHPFPDGNGRMGRLWQNLILSKWQHLFEWIPIETIIYDNQRSYYDMLEIGDRENDSTKFIEFMLEVILKTVSEFGHAIVVDKLDDILDDKLIDKLNDKEIEFLNVIYPYLKEHGEIVNSKAASLSGRPTGTTRRYLLRLVTEGVLTISGANKNRKYILK